ncbi:MAG: bifunctional UDP-N-acetylglucosamine diphosphorylase/glucosamine-1-phosphate N-acetyltransferase GlmU [Gammaproteobacteria bacterium]|nr:bifunctional UDP-N-acetylglucosamine diphosphorylase/glucosamine-1-phosphate N-acetyltransferase GlmU [Gammaproteobacteria bacterium]
MSAPSLAVVILAAGKGTRMHSSVPKVLHPLAGVPMLQRVVRTACELSEDIIVVTSPDAEAVRSELATAGVRFAVQERQRGTGDALAAALPEIPADIDQVLVLCGDVPLLAAATLQRLRAVTAAGGVSLVTARFPDPKGLGRILRDGEGCISGIVEERDATPAERRIDEINTGIYLLPRARLDAWLGRLDAGNAQGEYYLTDIIRFAVESGLAVASITCDDLTEVTGVNDRAGLVRLEREFSRRVAEQLLAAGVTVMDPARVDVRGELHVGQDTVIDVNCVFTGKVVIGRNVQVGAHCVIEDASIDDGAIIAPFTHIQGAHVGSEARVGPFARLREGTDLGERCRIGNFVETKNTQLGADSKANHLAYLGDAILGEGCNVGAGTITCNYDGVDKHPTILGDGVFVGSNSTLVAPVRVADRAYVAAGSTITSPVPADGLGVGRARQRNIAGWKRPKKTTEAD